jgi:hypothetical protein
MEVEDRWIDELFATIDRKDHTAFVGFLLPDARFRYGNNAPVHGRASIAEVVAGFFSALHAVQHLVDDRWMLPDTAIVTGTVIYTRHDRSTLQVPFANVLKLRDEGISDYLIFVDNSALFSV